MGVAPKLFSRILSILTPKTRFFFSLLHNNCATTGMLHHSSNNRHRNTKIPKTYKCEIVGNVKTKCTYNLSTQAVNQLNFNQRLTTSITNTLYTCKWRARECFMPRNAKSAMRAHANKIRN